MTDKAINRRDVVRLLSGGPALTVVAVLDTRCKCMWFNAAGHLQIDETPAEHLEEEGW